MDLRAGISEKAEDITAALVAAQKAIRIAAKRSTNPHFGKSYADLGSVWSACREVLTANNLCVTQVTDTDGDRVVLITTLHHVSGQWIRGIYPVKPMKADPQSYGSALTYARRYALASLVGVVAADEDDDANAASEQPQPTRQAYGNPPPPDAVDDFPPNYGATQPPAETTWNRFMAALVSATSAEQVEEIAANAKSQLDPSEYQRFRQDAADKWELLANQQVAAQ